MRDSNSLEVISPAGSLEHVRAAIAAGADTLYIGIKGMSARPDLCAFDLFDAKEASRIVHAAGKRIYYALNAGFAESDKPAVADILKQIDDSGCDALIVGDWGLLKYIRDMGIGIPMHASSLLGVYNAATVRFLRWLGVLRVILNVNLLPDEIAALVHACPETTFEIIAYGGICFHDQRRCGLPHMMVKGHYRVACEYFNYSYEDNTKYHSVVNFHAPDINLTSALAHYVDLGVTAFKIEGRTRSTDYVVASTTAMVQAVREYLGERAHEN